MLTSYSAGDFLRSYIKWHYGQGLHEMAGIYNNLSHFISHFFSFRLLLRTLFAPLSRIHEPYKRGLDLENLLSSLLINTLMRGVGAVARLAVLVIGLLAQVALFLATVVAGLVWVLFPLVLVVVIMVSGTLLASYLSSI